MVVVEDEVDRCCERVTLTFVSVTVTEPGESRGTRSMSEDQRGAQRMISCWSSCSQPRGFRTMS